MSERDDTMTTDTRVAGTTAPPSAPAGTPRSAGTLLREARLAQGVHIAALAATMKVSQKKLEALEADRLEELPDPTFTRALAQAVCRALKVDPAPVLALLPLHPGHRLEHVAEGLKQPFHERSGREPGEWLGALGSPAVLGVLLIVLLTAAVWLMPQQWLAALQAVPDAGAPTPAGTPSVVSSTIATPAPSAEAASGVVAGADGASAATAAPAEPVFAPVFGASAPAAGAPATEPPPATR